MRTHSFADLHGPLDAVAYRVHRAAVKLHELADRVKKLDRLFWHLQPGLSPDAPLLHFAPSHEIEEPFRSSNSAVVRLPGTRTGLVVGRWGITHGDEFAALTQALVPHREPNETELENYTDDHTHGPGPGRGGTFRVKPARTLDGLDPAVSEGLRSQEGHGFEYGVRDLPDAGADA